MSALTPRGAEAESAPDRREGEQHYLLRRLRRRICERSVNDLWRRLRRRIDDSAHCESVGLSVGTCRWTFHRSWISYALGGGFAAVLMTLHIVRAWVCRWGPVAGLSTAHG